MRIRVGEITNPSLVRVRVVRLFGWRMTLIYEWPRLRGSSSG